VVLGGLRKKEVVDQKNKVPFFGDLPLLGPLFTFNGEETINSELIVFITPWIVRQPEMTRSEIAAHQNTDIKMPPMTYTRAEKELMEKPQSQLQEKSTPPSVEDPNKG
jgi:type II secretory pathway component GspD/PulD (secretin)